MGNTIWNLYGARVSKSGKHVNLTIVQGKKDDKTQVFNNVCIKVEGTNCAKVVVKDNEVLLAIARLDVGNKPTDDTFKELEK